jgi:hypothetical protein
MAKILDITPLIELNKRMKAVEKAKAEIAAELIAQGDGLYEGTTCDVIVKGTEITVVPKEPKYSV